MHSRITFTWKLTSKHHPSHAVLLARSGSIIVELKAKQTKEICIALFRSGNTDQYMSSDCELQTLFDFVLNKKGE